MPKNYKCHYSHCKFGGAVDSSEAVQFGRFRYHEKCLTEKNLTQEIREIYLTEINPAETIVLLNKAIKTLLTEKKVDVEFLRFVVSVIARDKLNINNAFGLYYFVNNFKIKEEYEKILRKKRFNEFKEIAVSEIESKEVIFKVKDNKKKSNWGDMFG